MMCMIAYVGRDVSVVAMGTKASDPPAAGITGSYGLSDVGAGNWIQALCKSSVPF